MFSFLGAQPPTVADYCNLDARQSIGFLRCLACDNRYRCTAEAETMPKVTHITLRSEVPDGEKYILVTFGEKGGQERDALGLTITVARNASLTISDLSFLTAVHSAKEIAKQEHLATVFACR
jgi:hypothetical protein